ncbi:cysteine proteinase inhibitor, partial [Trifolium medium]|nr:cysteine proteinase inhibitor [Trifolium medium]
MLRLRRQVEGRICGGITEVEGSENDPKFISLARFAVEQHNKKENAILEFVKVVNAKQQGVAGMLYYITLHAKVGEKVNVYEAKIWERDWLNLIELTEFKLIEGGYCKLEDLPANNSLARFAVDQQNKKNLRRAASTWTGVSNVGGRPRKLSKYNVTDFNKYLIDPTDYNLARLAVDKYNLKKNANLEFVKVVHKKQFSSTGTFYNVTLEAKDGEK